MSWRGVFTGSLSLIAIQAVLSSDAAARRFGGMFDHVADLVTRVLDPSVAAIPDLSGAGTDTGEVDTGDAAAATPTGNPAGAGDRNRNRDERERRRRPRLPPMTDVQPV